MESILNEGKSYLWAAASRGYISLSCQNRRPWYSSVQQTEDCILMICLTFLRSHHTRDIHHKDQTTDCPGADVI
ncbi:hypothetical protein QQP08_027295 [Theobroma cacao]|nr:hypothetical protein QQP08_027295 [Theobroma cacao]